MEVVAARQNNLAHFVNLSAVRFDSIRLDLKLCIRSIKIFRIFASTMVLSDLLVARLIVRTHEQLVCVVRSRAGKDFRANCATKRRCLRCYVCERERSSAERSSGKMNLTYLHEHCRALALTTRDLFEEFAILSRASFQK